MAMKERIRTRCTDKFYKKIERAAKKRGRSVSSLIRWILDNWLRRNK